MGHDRAVRRIGSGRWRARSLILLICLFATASGKENPLSSTIPQPAVWKAEFQGLSSTSRGAAPFGSFNDQETDRAMLAAAAQSKTQAVSGAARPTVAQALEKFAKFDDAGALELANEALRNNPNNSMALALRGVLTAADAYYKTGDPARKESVARCRRELTPLLGENLGFESLSPQEKARCRAAMKSALSDVELAAARERVDERVSLCRGLVYLWRIDIDGVENADQAIADFTHAIQLNGESADAYYYRAWARFKQTPSSALVAIYNWWRKNQKHEPGTYPPPPAINAEIERALSLFDLWYPDYDKWSNLREKSQDTFRLKRPGNEWATLATEIMFLDMAKQALAHAPREMDNEIIFEKARNSIVRVEWEDADMIISGTGFGVEEITGKILTNEHVVHGAPGGRVTVIKYGGKKLDGQVAKVDEKRDLAIVGVRSLSVDSLRVMPPESREMVNSWARFGTKVTVGERVVVIGHPMGMNWSMSRGIVSAVREIDGVHYLQTDAAVNHGNSGGPILNSYGEVVGVATWGVSGSEGLNFGVLSEEVLDFLYSKSNRP